MYLPKLIRPGEEGNGTVPDVTGVVNLSMPDTGTINAINFYKVYKLKQFLEVHSRIMVLWD